MLQYGCFFPRRKTSILLLISKLILLRICCCCWWEREDSSDRWRHGCPFFRSSLTEPCANSARMWGYYSAIRQTCRVRCLYADQQLVSGCRSRNRFTRIDISFCFKARGLIRFRLLSNIILRPPTKLLRYCDTRRLSVNLLVTIISQKVIDGFEPDFLEW